MDRKYLADALAFSARTLSDADRLSLEIFISDLRTAIDAAQFPNELVPINQFQSLPTLMPVLGSGRARSRSAMRPTTTSF